jgi:hypothetical protein
VCPPVAASRLSIRERAKADDSVVVTVAISEVENPRVGAHHEAVARLLCVFIAHVQAAGEIHVRSQTLALLFIPDVYRQQDSEQSTYGVQEERSRVSKDGE